MNTIYYINKYNINIFDQPDSLRTEPLLCTTQLGLQVHSQAKALPGSDKTCDYRERSYLSVLVTVQGHCCDCRPI